MGKISDSFKKSVLSELKSKKITKVEICEKTHISRPTLNRYLDEGNPGLLEVEAIANVLNKDPSSILFPESLSRLIKETAPHTLEDCLKVVTEAALKHPYKPSSVPNIPPKFLEALESLDWEGQGIEAWLEAGIEVHSKKKEEKKKA